MFDLGTDVFRVDDGGSIFAKRATDVDSVPLSYVVAIITVVPNLLRSLMRYSGVALLGGINLAAKVMVPAGGEASGV